MNFATPTRTFTLPGTRSGTPGGEREEDERREARKATVSDKTLITLLRCAVGWARALGRLHGPWTEAAVLLVLGFFFIASLPLGLELPARSVGPSQAGIANSIVWEFSQVGGFLILLAYPAVAGAWGWTSLFYITSGLTAIGLGLAALLRAR